LEKRADIKSERKFSPSDPIYLASVRRNIATAMRLTANNANVAPLSGTFTGGCPIPAPNGTMDAKNATIVKFAKFIFFIYKAWRESLYLANRRRNRAIVTTARTSKANVPPLSGTGCGRRATIAAIPAEPPDENNAVIIGLFPLFLAIESAPSEKAPG
jgi:hypothetical protein